MRNRMSIKTNELIAEAWDFLWKDNLKQRARQKPDAYHYATTYYLTASDVEYQVRQFIIEDLKGEPRGSRGRTCGRPWEPVRVSGNLNGAVRDWLLHNSNIVGHNFNRGHISGMRFRPRGEPLAPAEIATMKEKERRRTTPRPVHFGIGEYGRRLLCMEGRKRSMFSRHRGRGSWTTDKPEDVTCPRCKKLLVARDNSSAA